MIYPPTISNVASLVTMVISLIVPVKLKSLLFKQRHLIPYANFSDMKRVALPQLFGFTPQYLTTTKHEQ